MAVQQLRLGISVETRSPEVQLITGIENPPFYSAIRKRYRRRFATSKELRTIAARFNPEQLLKLEGKLEQLRFSEEEKEISRLERQVRRTRYWLMMSQQIPADPQFILDRQLDFLFPGCASGIVRQVPTTGAQYHKYTVVLEVDQWGIATEYYSAWSLHSSQMAA